MNTNLTIDANMKSFIVSHILGYDSHLPTKRVKLPLKYLPGLASKDATDIYSTNCLGHSEFIDMSAQYGLFFSVVQAGITKDMSRLRLMPILTDDATSLGVQFQSLEFVLPHPVIGKGTFSHIFMPLSSAEEPYIIVDILDESYLLVTFRIELNDFLVGNVRNRLVLDNFGEWVNISVPYSFELRSSPFFMKAINANNLIVSMNDGGLLHFQRSKPLSSVDIFNFSDLAPLVSLNFVGNLFSGPSKAEATIGGFSCNAVVDIAELNDDEFVTFSLNQTVKVYNMKTHKQTKAQSALAILKGNTEWVTNVTNKYFQIHAFLSRKTLSLMIPTEDDMGDDETPTYGFVSWDISQGKLEKLEYLHLETNSIDPRYYVSGDSKGLRVQDFQIVECETSIEYYVLYKSNTYSEVVHFSEAKSSKTITLITKSLPQQASIFAELSNHRECQYYLNTIFNSGMCDKRVVASALRIFIQNSETLPVLDDSMSLRQKVVSTITSISNAKGISESSAWYKFALICLEFRRSSHEALSLLVQQDFMLCSEVNGVGVYRKAHPFEVKFHEPDNDHFTDLIKSVSSKLSTKTFNRILEEVGSTPIIDMPKARELASKLFSGKISNQETDSLMQQLDSIPDIVEKFNDLIGISSVVDYNREIDSLPAAGEGSGLFSMLLIIESFESIRKRHVSLLVHILVLLLLCEANDVIIGFMNSIIKRLRVYGIMSDIFNICFASSGSYSAIENGTVSIKENSLFWGVCVRKNPKLQHLIQEREYNAAFEYYTHHVLIAKSDETILAVAIELLNRDESAVVLDEFVPRMDDSSPINSFVTGITFLLNRRFEKFQERLTDYTLFERVNDDQTREILLNHLEGSPSIHEFFTSIFIGASDSVVTKSNYFHQLSHLVKLTERSTVSQMGPSERHDLLELALKLETTAIDIMSPTSDVPTTSHLTSLYLRDHFDTAVEIKNFEEAAISLSELKKVSGKSDYKLLFTKLIKSLIQFHEFEKLFAPGHRNIFARNYLLVDSILLKLANEDLALSNALKCYELLFSWRLLGPVLEVRDKDFFVDKRGAAEALYVFITKFQIQQDNLGSDSEQSKNFHQFRLKVLELYKIVLTTLKSLSDEEDRWIRKRGDNKSWTIVTITELNIEYFHWLKNLEGDFAEN